jgi:hypothetical protein
MRRRFRLFPFLRWCLTAGTLLIAGASGLSLVYNFGLIRTVPYPTGDYAPIHTTMVMTDGGFIYLEAQGATHARPDSPYVVIGNHWQWRRGSDGRAWTFWRATIHPGWVELPAWLLVGPPALLMAGAWWPAIVRRLRRKPFHCACGYDRRGLASAALCPECGAAAG